MEENKKEEIEVVESTETTATEETPAIESETDVVKEDTTAESDKDTAGDTTPVLDTEVLEENTERIRNDSKKHFVFSKEASKKRKSTLSKEGQTIICCMALFFCLTLCYICYSQWCTAEMLNNYLGRGSSVVGCTNSSSSSSDFSNTAKAAQEIVNYYDTYYIGDSDPQDKDALEDTILDTIVSSYNDKYGTYLNPEQAAKFTDEFEENLSGIGAMIRGEEDGFYITRVFPDSPAEKAGVQPQWKLIEANGFTVANSDLTTVLNNVKGEAGTKVVAKFQTSDNPEDVVELEITRATVEAPSVNTSILQADNKKIGLLDIRSFSCKTADEFEAALKDMEEAGIKNIIIDLRDNGGGSAPDVIKMTRLLIDNGTITSVASKQDKEEVIIGATETYYARNGIKIDASEYSDIPEKTYKFNMCILVNENSASASELFSKALQSKGLATVIGLQTYGKGTLLSVEELSNGGCLVLSTGLYYTYDKDNNKDENIEGVGVTPDIDLSNVDKEVLDNYYRTDLEDITKDPYVKSALDIFNAETK